jgi:hypothetical protein
MEQTNKSTEVKSKKYLNCIENIHRNEYMTCAAKEKSTGYLNCIRNIKNAINIDKEAYLKCYNNYTTQPHYEDETPSLSFEIDKTPLHYLETNEDKDETPITTPLLSSENDDTNKTPLYHFMMGKGKTAVITPILLLFFTLIQNKNVTIIMPEFLINQSYQILQPYIIIFNISDKIKIMSDAEIKINFLEEIETNKTYINGDIFLIDECDTIINPLRSELNMIKNKIDIEKNSFIYQLINIIYNNITQEIPFPNTPEYNITIDEINNLKKLIKENKFKYNIDWGIHPNELFAIPFKNKDNPLLKSNFVSIVITIYLTIYFYHNIKSYELFKKNICEYIKQNKDTLKILKISIFQEITMETVDKLIGDNEMYKEFIFDILTKNIKIIKNQLNTSFIDILNLDNVFKIGYSGTINMSLPKNTILIPDNDENKNVSYAISQSKINYEYDQINILNKMNHYNILIDICGLFFARLNSIIINLGGISIMFYTNRAMQFFYENNTPTSFDALYYR